MTRVILIRHGETVWNARGLYQGQEDSPLTPEGQVQAQALAERMRQHPPIDALYTSDLPRTHATAAPTAACSVRRPCSPRHALCIRRAERSVSTVLLAARRRASAWMATIDRRAVAKPAAALPHRTAA